MSKIKTTVFFTNHFYLLTQELQDCWLQHPNVKIQKLKIGQSVKRTRTLCKIDINRNKGSLTSRVPILGLESRVRVRVSVKGED